MNNSSGLPIAGTPGKGYSTPSQEPPPAQSNAQARRALFTRSLAERTGNSLLSNIDERKPSSPPPPSSQQDAQQLVKKWQAESARYQFEPKGEVADMADDAKRSPRSPLQQSSPQGLLVSTQLSNLVPANSNSSSNSTTTTNTTIATITTNTTPTVEGEAPNGAPKNIITRLKDGTHGKLDRKQASPHLKINATRASIIEDASKESLPRFASTNDSPPSKIKNEETTPSHSEGRQRSASSPAKRLITSNSPGKAHRPSKPSSSSSLSRSSNVKTAPRENRQAGMKQSEARDLAIAEGLQEAIQQQASGKDPRAQISLDKLLAHESNPRLITLVYKGESQSSIDAYLCDSLLSLRGNLDCVLIFEALPPNPTVLSISSCGEVPKFIKQDLGKYRLEGLEDSAFLSTTTNMGYLNSGLTDLANRWDSLAGSEISKAQKTQLENSGAELLLHMNQELVRLRPDMIRIASEIRHGNSDEKKAKKQKKSYLELYQTAMTKSTEKPSPHNLKRAAQALLNLQLAYAKHESINQKGSRGDDMRLRWAQHIDKLLSSGKTVIYCGNAANSLSLDIKPPAETDDDDVFISQPPNFQTAGVVDRVTGCTQTERMTLYFHNDVKAGASYSVASKLKFDGLGEASTVQKVISVPSTLYESPITKGNSSATS
jgi:hypothetical protein